jgi:hypothetical protein
VDHRPQAGAEVVRREGAVELEDLAADAVAEEIARISHRRDSKGLLQVV